MKKHSQWIVILIITVAVFSSLISQKNMQNDELQPIIVVNNPIPSNGLDSPIVIRNDSDLAMTSSSGDGNSWETAYVIENFTISSNSTDGALHIENTTKYCIIRNNYFENSYYADSSIYLNYTSNIRIINNSLYHSSKGLYAWNSSNIQIQENNMIDNARCIYLAFMDNVTVSNNRLHYTRIGLSIRRIVGSVQIHDNFYYCQEAENPYGYTLKLENISNFSLRNEFSRDPLRAILDDCHNFAIENCTFGRVRITRSQNFTVQDCRVLSDIAIEDGLDFSLTENIVEGSELLSRDAFRLTCCYDYNITRNRIEHYDDYVFYIIGDSSGEVPDFQPLESKERIEFNFIMLNGRTLIGYRIHWNSSQEYINRIESQKLGWNWVIPPISFIIMSIIIVIAVFLIITAKSKLLYYERKLERTQIKTLHLIIDYQHFFYLRILKIGLMIGSILIPLTLISIYSNSGWVSWFTGIKYEFHPGEIFQKSNYTSEEFKVAHNVISIIWIVFFTIFLIIALFYARSPKMLRKQRSILYGFQIRNIILVIFGAAILLAFIYILMVYGFWIYIGYLFSILMLGGFLWSFLPKPRYHITKYRWKLLIGFILQILSQGIIHIVSGLDRWTSDNDPVVVSLNILRVIILLGVLIERRND